MNPGTLPWELILNIFEYVPEYGLLVDKELHTRAFNSWPVSCYSDTWRFIIFNEIKKELFEKKTRIENIPDRMLRGFYLRSGSTDFKKFKEKTFKNTMHTEPGIIGLNIQVIQKIELMIFAFESSFGLTTEGYINFPLGFEPLVYAKKLAQPYAHDYCSHSFDKYHKKSFACIFPGLENVTLYGIDVLSIMVHFRSAENYEKLKYIIGFINAYQLGLISQKDAHEILQKYHDMEECSKIIMSSIQDDIDTSIIQEFFGEYFYRTD